MQKTSELNPEVVVLNIFGENRKPALETASKIVETFKTGFVFISDKPLPEQTDSDSLSFSNILVLQPFEKSELKTTIDAIIQKLQTSEKPNTSELSKERDDTDNLFFSATINDGIDNLADGNTETLKKEPPSTKIGDINPSAKSAENILESVLELTYGSEGKEGLLVQLTDLLSSAIPKVDFISAYYVENQKDELLFLAGMTPDNMNDLATLPSSSGLPWASIISEVPEYIKDTYDSKFINDAEKEIGFKSCISLPIRQSGITIGSLNLFSIHSASAFSQEIFSLMNTNARQVELTFSYIGKANDLIELEQRFQNLFNNCPLGVMLIDNAPTVYQCNRLASEIFQSTSDKIVGMEIKEIGHDTFTASVSEVLEGKYTRCEFSFNLPGTEQASWVAASLLPLHSVHENVNGGMIVLEEITERKNMENHLSEEKEILSITLKSIADGVIARDSSGNIALMNMAAEKIVELSQAEVIGKRLDDILIVESDEDQRNFSGTLAMGKVIGAKDEINIKTLSNIQKIISISSSPIRDHENNEVGEVIGFRDITEQQKFRQELAKIQKLESLETLAGGIAHDFNNLFTCIIGNLSLSKIYVDSDDKIYKRLTQAEFECFKAADLTRQLINFAEDVSPNTKVSSIAELVKESVKFLLTGSKVKCTFNCSDEVWLVEIDQKQIIQAIYDIVLNSLQAVPAGGTIHTSVQNVNIK